MINLKKERIRWWDFSMNDLITNGPSDIEQTDDGNLGVEDSREEIVGRRKFSELFVVDGWMDGVRVRCFCSFEAAKLIRLQFFFMKRKQRNRILYFESWLALVYYVL